MINPHTYGFETEKLGKLCHLNIGKTPHRAEPRYWGPGHPWLSIKDMNQGQALSNTTETITDAAVSECNCKVVEPGTVMMSFKLSIGKVGIAQRRLYSNEAIVALPVKRPKTLDVRYLMHFLSNADFGGAGANRAVMGLTLNKASLALIDVPMPPIEEQRRIAAILDKADAIRRKRREAIALTEELLRSTFLEMFGDPVTNPKGWPVRGLGKLADFIGGGTPSRKNPHYFTGSVCWATPKDMQADVLEDTIEHITQEAVDSSATKLVAPNALLVVVKSKVLARRLPVARTTVATCFGQDLKAIVPKDERSVRYLHRHLLAGAPLLLRKARGANTEGLTLAHLRGFPVMQPPYDLVERFDQIETALVKQRSAMRRAAAEADDLFHSLVQRAFRGDL